MLEVGNKFSQFQGWLISSGPIFFPFSKSLDSIMNQFDCNIYYLSAYKLVIMKFPSIFDSGIAFILYAFLVFIMGTGLWQFIKSRYMLKEGEEVYNTP